MWMEILKFIVGFGIVTMIVLVVYACIVIAGRADDQEEVMLERLEKEKKEREKNLDKGDM
mgnify:CR=1 FL=1